VLQAKAKHNFRKPIGDAAIFWFDGDPASFANCCRRISDAIAFSNAFGYRIIHRRVFWWALGARHLRLRRGGQSAA
jgi:hypothetical protein